LSLKKYLENKKVDDIEDDQIFMETEYEVIKTYCEDHKYSISNEDLEIIKNRGLEDYYADWKQMYVEDLWEEFGEVPMNPETEKIEMEWNNFPPGTHREEIWHWFEDQFKISVAQDLMNI